jgi:hypothetical protein
MIIMIHHLRGFVTHKRANFIDGKVNEVSDLFLRPVASLMLLSYRLDTLRVFFFAGHCQVQSFADVSFALFDEQVSGFRIGLHVGVAQSFEHTECDGFFVDDIWPGINGDIDIAVRIARGQDTETFDACEIFR